MVRTNRTFRFVVLVCIAVQPCWWWAIAVEGFTVVSSFLAVSTTTTTTAIICSNKFAFCRRRYIYDGVGGGLYGSSSSSIDKEYATAAASKSNVQGAAAPISNAQVYCYWIDEASDATRTLQTKQQLATAVTVETETEKVQQKEPTSAVELQQQQQQQALAYAQRAAWRTWNWCSRFVVPHRLCPWASGSVHQQNAVQIHVLVTAAAAARAGATQIDATSPSDTLSSDEQLLLEGLVRKVAESFAAQLQHEQAVVDPNAAIALVVLVPPPPDDRIASTTTTTTTTLMDFPTFFDWFCELEEKWLQEEDENGGLNSTQGRITLAPFHPNWEYASGSSGGSGGDGTDEEDEEEDGKGTAGSINIEKQSPYPTVSLVSSDVVAKAGEAVTYQIANSNAATLRKRDALEWKRLYEEALRMDN